MNITQKRFGGRVYHATKTEDTKDHIDFWWESDDGNKKVGFDVKGLRKNKRSDTSFDDSIQWIELVNVQGNKGWVYGKADYITFMTNKFVLYVRRKDLVQYIEDKTVDKSCVYSIPDEYYIPYQRKNRSDMIVKIPTIDLIPLSKHTIKI